MADLDPTLPSETPAIPGLILRGFRGPADFDGIAAVMTASLADHNG